MTATQSICHHIDGHALCECEAESLRGAVEQAVRKGVSLKGANLADANLRGANLRGADLADANLARADLAGAILARAYLAGAYLADANLRGADLADANLADANLAGANLGRAYLAGAYLAGATLIDAGQESRGYRFVGVPTDGVRILAGCRWFTVTEAREHWSGNPEALAKAALIEAEAARRGWIA